MPRPDVTHCKRCGRHRDECGPLSWTRQCAECALLRATDNMASIATHTGPGFKEWRRGMAASVGAVLPDDA